jgi:hypothetical protein
MRKHLLMDLQQFHCQNETFRDISSKTDIFTRWRGNNDIIRSWSCISLIEDFAGLGTEILHWVRWRTSCSVFIKTSICWIIFFSDEWLEAKIHVSKIQPRSKRLPIGVGVFLRPAVEAVRLCERSKPLLSRSIPCWSSFVFLCPL